MVNKYNLNLSSLEIFTHCPRQWALREVDNEWADNAFTIQGNIVHSLVDDPNFSENRGKFKVVRSLPLFNDDLNIQGVADCIEFHKSENGTFIEELDGKYKIKVIEYKSGKWDDGKIEIWDAMQLRAQMACVDFMFGGESEGYLYYHKNRRRIKLNDREGCYQKLIEVIDKINYYFESKTVPPIAPDQHCNGCSMWDICMPKTKVDINFDTRLNNLLKREQE